MNKEETIERIINLEKERKDCDSKTREKEIWDELESLCPEQFNGSLVLYKKKDEIKKGRLWNSHYGQFKVFGNSKRSFKWTSNYDYISLNAVTEWLSENNSDLEEKLGEIDSKINRLESEIRVLKAERREVCKDVFPYVDPSTFEETEEENRSAFNLGGGKVYISESFCQITGDRITS